MEYILAIDQGTSYTRAAISDITGNIIGFNKSGGACHSVTGMESAMKMINEASSGAIKNAGIDAKNISLLYSGMTGADFEDEYILLHGEISKLNICKNIVVKSDSIIALRGGTLKHYGAILNAGSGVNCAVISPEGQEFIYQYYVEDYIQGGGAISRRMLDAIYKAHTFRTKPTKITELVLEQLHFKDVDQLLRADVEKKISVDKRLAIVPLLFEAAFEKDTISVNIVKEISKAFAGLIFGGVNRFSLNNTEFEVVMSGSIFKAKGNLLIDTFVEEIKRFAPKAKVINAVYEPVVGAVILGIEHLTKTLNEKTLQNIEKSSVKFSLRRNSSDPIIH